ncbi:hypothetical protein FB451DRAFT_1183302 [Mycena latifolia]|nr:hypothetical protein FB451DRAFT_1183302 [Mycena latifolia]
MAASLGEKSMTEDSTCVDDIPRGCNSPEQRPWESKLKLMLKRHESEIGALRRSVDVARDNGTSARCGKCPAAVEACEEKRDGAQRKEPCPLPFALPVQSPRHYTGLTKDGQADLPSPIGHSVTTQEGIHVNSCSLCTHHQGQAPTNETNESGQVAVLRSGKIVGDQSAAASSPESQSPTSAKIIMWTLSSSLLAICLCHQLTSLPVVILSPLTTLNTRNEASSPVPKAPPYSPQSIGVNIGYGCKQDLPLNNINVPINLGRDRYIQHWCANHQPRKTVPAAKSLYSSSSYAPHGPFFNVDARQDMCPCVRESAMRAGVGELMLDK